MENWVADCQCTLAKHDTRLIAFTGGPGAGKSAVLEVARREFCKHVLVLPEAASIVYLGGFIRDNTPLAIKAVQRAIYHVQNELHQLVFLDKRAALGLCDRATLDGLAYWPGPESTFFEDLHTTREKELAKYSVVVHMRTPSAGFGYNQVNPARVESADEALVLDERIEKVWRDHPRRIFIESSQNFSDKIDKVLQIIAEEVPACCRRK